MSAAPQRIAILGATSQIARDLVVSMAADSVHDLHLFARRPEIVRQWLDTTGLPGRYPADEFSALAGHEFDAIINFVGIGNPAQAVALGNSIFDVTLRFDEMALGYLRTHAACRYLFLSSGAVYGSAFDTPASRDTLATVAVNNLSAQAWYGAAKLHAECRHRAHTDSPIIDIRVFNYFSHTQDMSARFLISDIMRAIRDDTVLQTAPGHMVRDFLHPSDFYGLVSALLSAPPANAAVDCYSRAAIAKPELLTAMQQKFGLRYEVNDTAAGVNATGPKPCYYSLNNRAAEFGYRPQLTSLQGVLQEAELALRPCR
jgi:nucleoside-diphosphate-sugar epimerase